MVDKAQNVHRYLNICLNHVQMVLSGECTAVVVLSLARQYNARFLPAGLLTRS